MNQVIPNLWVGDLVSALDFEELQKNNIHSVLTVMRKMKIIHPNCIHKQIDLDDNEVEDVLVHLIPSISFIQEQLDNGRGVLVHCQAGISRSPTILTAYLMYSQNIDESAALDLIRKVRPQVQPNDSFLSQLQIFHRASFKVSRRDKATRMFYLERAVNEVMNGDGSDLQTDMFAKFPRTPSDSTPATPGGGPRRRIRCKACRQELAAREHMMDHGQLGPPTPVSAAMLSPAESRRPSFTETKPRRSSMKEPPESRPRRLSNGDHVAGAGLRRASQPRMGSFSSDGRRPLSALEGAPLFGRGLSDSLSMSAVEDDTDEDEPTNTNTTVKTENTNVGLAHSSDLSAELYANPTLAALRSAMGGLSMTPLQANIKPVPPILPPILANPKCSGYFVEPMRWMDPFLETGEMAGKIICPNKKCGAKLGSYDWAGVCCSCKEWVVPGFCIHRSKVDEIIT